MLLSTAFYNVRWLAVQDRIRPLPGDRLISILFDGEIVGHIIVEVQVVEVGIIIG